ncbi:TlpA disulfide reductase family protein [Bacillaceae bacterium]
MSRGIVAVLFIVVLLGLAVFTNVNEKEAARREERPEIGYAAPAFELTGLDGKVYRLKESGKPVVINFWASWCGPCREEAPELVRLYDRYRDKVEIYAVNLTANDDLHDVKAFVDEFAFPFPVLLDETGQVATAYRVQAIPTTYFVNEQGVIVEKIMGLVPQERLEALFAELADD